MLKLIIYTILKRLQDFKFQRKTPEQVSEELRKRGPFGL